MQFQVLGNLNTCERRERERERERGREDENHGNPIAMHNGLALDSIERYPNR